MPTLPPIRRIADPDRPPPARRSSDVMDGIEWRPELSPSAIPLTIVCGAPASGKSTYVAAHAAPGDIVVDLDDIGAALSRAGHRVWDRRRWLRPAIAQRNAMLRSLADRNEGAAWFIIGSPGADERDWWAERLRPVQVVVMETPETVCYARTKTDPSGGRTADRAGS